MEVSKNQNTTDNTRQPTDINTDKSIHQIIDKEETDTLDYQDKNKVRLTGKRMDEIITKKEQYIDNITGELKKEEIELEEDMENLLDNIHAINGEIPKPSMTRHSDPVISKNPKKKLIFRKDISDVVITGQLDIDLDENIKYQVLCKNTMKNGLMALTAIPIGMAFGLKTGILSAISFLMED